MSCWRIVATHVTAHLVFKTHVVLLSDELSAYRHAEELRHKGWEHVTTRCVAIIDAAKAPQLGVPTPEAAPASGHLQ